MAVSLAQALTKSRYDSTRSDGNFSVGEWVLIYRSAPNRLMSHFIGPYKITKISDDNNFVWANHYINSEGTSYGPYHISRLMRFDFKRATPAELVEHELAEDTDLVKNIVAHRALANGTFEFLVEWVHDPIQSWMGGQGLKRVTKALDYCKLNSLPTPGSGPRRTTATPTPGRGRGRGRGRAKA